MNLLVKETPRNFVLLSIFGIAMGFLEAIVVIYLRQIYYPQGFNFPLAPLSLQMFFVECLREICTIVMLISVGIITGKNYLQKFSYFIYTFAIWDIFYYVGLKLLLNWPPSFLTWDILFLIPLPWIGPVLVPIICSLTMIFLAGSIIWLQEKGCTRVRLSELGLVLGGAFAIFYTFISEYKPTCYNWRLFIFGEVLILCALVLMVKRTRSAYICATKFENSSTVNLCGKF